METTLEALLLVQQNLVEAIQILEAIAVEEDTDFPYLEQIVAVKTALDADIAAIQPVQSTQPVVNVV